MAGRTYGEWRATIGFGLDGEPRLLDFEDGALTDEGADVTHDEPGHYTISFPKRSVIFVESLILSQGEGPCGAVALLHEIGQSELTLHTEINQTPGVDPSPGSRLYLKLVFR